MGFVFCDSYYSTNRGASTGRGGARCGGWVGKDRAGGPARASGSSMGALCTRFTIVFMMVIYNPSVI